MKRLTLVTLMLLFIGALMAQEEQEKEMKTLFGNSGIRSNGGYGGVTVGYTQMDDRDALLIGGRGAWVINHSMAIGLAGYGFLSEHKPDAQLNGDYHLAGGYGGLMFEFIAAPKSPIHVSFPVVIGAGGVGYVERDGIFGNSDINPFSEDSQAFFVVEPGIELEMNLLRFMRLGLGVSYRYTSDIDLSYRGNGGRIMGSDALNGLSGGITLKFGKF